MDTDQFPVVLSFLTVFLAQTAVAQLTLDPGGNNIATFINQKIQRTLSENPEILDASNLAKAFNAERNQLQSALIAGSGSEDDFNRAEQALEKFRNFVQKYKIIDNMLQQALNDLRDYQANDGSPLEGKYMALSLQTSLDRVGDLNEAERFLKQYAAFKESATPGLKPGVAVDYKPYFEEILYILRNYFGQESPEMANVVKKFLAHPELIKQIYTKLRRSTEKEEEADEGESGESIWNALEYF